MSQTGTSAWWADVQYLRDAAERTDEARRRADRAELAARRASRDRRRIEAETAPAPASETAPPRRRLEPDLPPPRRRLEPDLPPPRRRDHVDAAAVVPRRGGYAEAAAVVPRRGGYAEAAAAVPRRGRYGGDEVALPGRRTIEIRGRTVPAPDVPRTPRPAITPRRPPRLASERVGPRPDRLAMWAMLMGIVLILVALTT